MRILLFFLIFSSYQVIADIDFLNHDTGKYPVAAELIQLEKRENVKLRTMSQLISFDENSDVIQRRAKDMGVAFVNAGHLGLIVYKESQIFPNQCGIKFEIFNGKPTKLITIFNEVILNYVKETELCNAQVISKIEVLVDGS